jgi:hypothetical protein
MRFDAAKALDVFQELGDPRFAGPDCETRVADFVAEQFAGMGWQVENDRVVGSGFPEWAASWASWLGFGIVMTVALTIVWTFGSQWPAYGFGWPLLILGALWLYLALRLGFRFGWDLPPKATAPLVVARRGHQSLPFCRVIFQTPIGRISADHHTPSSWLSSIWGEILCIFLIYDVYSIALDGHHLPLSLFHMKIFGFGLLVLLWIYVAGRAISAIRSRRTRHILEPADRTGVAVLLELARTWSSPRTHRVEIVFAGAGGQLFDFAGTRAMTRWVSAESPRIPTLRLNWFAPGIGKKLVIASRNLRDLARTASESLWLPSDLTSRSFRRTDLWPSDRGHQDFVAFIGADYGKWFRGADRVDSSALHHTAQLATEIALRWIKQQQPAQAPDSAA